MYRKHALVDNHQFTWFANSGSYWHWEQHVGDPHDEAAAHRDDSAARRDRKADRRDEYADGRDGRAVDSELSEGGIDASAAKQREFALTDRQDSASDRQDSADDRTESKADRHRAADDRAASSIDQLTGAYRRDAGMIELARDLDTARRTRRDMIIGFVDVDGLKRVNDEKGHEAGDLALQNVVRGLRSRLRQYDLIIRFGGDEFVFAVVGVPESDVRERIDTVNLSLREGGGATITHGLTTVVRDDTLHDAIARADSDLYRRRRAMKPA
ncbi:GGDEF domain-containing protein [Rhodococcoides trifolii]|nr:GGDEF domain-containing protein [Rhodococcus trifolii]